MYCCIIKYKEEMCKGVVQQQTCFLTAFSGMKVMNIEMWLLMYCSTKNH